MVHEVDFVQHLLVIKTCRMLIGKQLWNILARSMQNSWLLWIMIIIVILVLSLHQYISVSMGFMSFITFRYICFTLLFYFTGK